MPIAVTTQPGGGSGQVWDCTYILTRTVPENAYGQTQVDYFLNTPFLGELGVKSTSRCHSAMGVFTNTNQMLDYYCDGFLGDCTLELEITSHSPGGGETVVASKDHYRPFTFCGLETKSERYEVLVPGGPLVQSFPGWSETMIDMTGTQCVAENRDWFTNQFDCRALCPLNNAYNKYNGTGVKKCYKEQTGTFQEFYYQNGVIQDDFGQAYYNKALCYEVNEWGYINETTKHSDYN